MDATPLDSTPTPRSQHTLFVLPDDGAVVPTFLIPALDRAHDASDAVLPLILLLTSDTDATVSLAESAGRVAETRPDGVRPTVLAATGASRAARLLRAGAPTIVVGTPAVVLTLIRDTAL
jgi:hypothetical protein